MKDFSFLSLILTSIIMLGVVGCISKQSEWKRAQGPLLSRFAKDVSPDSVHQEYPRPQLVRNEWVNLNGLWEYTIVEKGDKQPDEYDGKILVPFPIESALSGVMEGVGEQNELWYKRTFNVKKEWVDQKKRIVLNFGAIDWESTVWINGKQAGSHKGGYDSFSFDITDYLTPNQAQELVVKVWDPVDKGTQPRGKQVINPHAIWYTSVTGIWQTVWLEPVTEMHIESIKISPDIDRARLGVDLSLKGEKPGCLIISSLFLDGRELSQVHTKPGNSIFFDIEDQKLWTPDSPTLYDLDIKVVDSEGNVLDEVQSYTGMRKISIEKFGSKSPRIFLNNEFVFQVGPLDQGWWPDGLYTAPSDEALKYDIEVTKQLGFNMARKHVKVEPARWYYWCDKLGLMVWQDMPSGDEYIGKNDPDLKRTKESARQFELELKKLVTQFGNHPSIVIWVPFNEGWGQYDTERIVKYVKSIDPSRLVINTSGWADRKGVGDIHDIHAYPGPAMPEPEKKRAIVLGEFGGLGLPLEGHTWQNSNNWGYRSYKNSGELTSAYTNLFRALLPMVGKGLSAAVYTQTTDVEVEVNGLMTYDRAVIKMDPEKVKRVNQGFLPPIIVSEHDIFTSTLEIAISNEFQKGQIYYTLDGKKPTMDSPVYTNPVKIKDTRKVQAFTAFEDGTRSEITEKSFNKVKLVAPVLEDGLKEGLACTYYELNDQGVVKLPNFDAIEIKSDKIVKNIGFDLAKRDEFFGLRFSGYIHVPADGIYTFYSNSDDGSQLLIQNQIVVENDGIHGMIEKSGEIALKKGLHNFQVNYFQGAGQGKGGKGLNVSYKGPGIEKEEIKADAFYHK